MYLIIHNIRNAAVYHRKIAHKLRLTSGKYSFMYPINSCFFDWYQNIRPENEVRWNTTRNTRYILKGWFHILHMTDCDTLNCLATLSWILPFCSIPMGFHLVFFVKNCMTSLEDRNSINVGQWSSRILKEKSCEYFNRVLRGWRLTVVVPVDETLRILRADP